MGSILARNTLYQTYNQVIDQLVAENSITVTPPDFYTWFQTHQTQIFPMAYIRTASAISPWRICGLARYRSGRNVT